jgi:hypothetical protein
LADFIAAEYLREVPGADDGGEFFPCSALVRLNGTQRLQSGDREIQLAPLERIAQRHDGDGPWPDDEPWRAGGWAGALEQDQ